MHVIVYHENMDKTQPRQHSTTVWAVHRDMLLCEGKMCTDVINPEKVDNWQPGRWGSRANQESCQRGFSCGPAGRWTAVSPMETLQSGRHTGGQSRVSALALEVEPAFWWSGDWHQEQAGLSSGREREITHTTTHTLPHSCWGANGGWQGGLLLKSCRCLEMAFMWMGALIGVVWRLLLHAEHPVILFCWVLINKQRLKATMHLEGQHSDSLVALMLFVFESYSNSHWGNHIRWEALTFFLNYFHSS